MVCMMVRESLRFDAGLIALGPAAVNMVSDDVSEPKSYILLVLGCVFGLDKSKALCEALTTPSVCVIVLSHGGRAKDPALYPLRLMPSSICSLIEAYDVRGSSAIRPSANHGNRQKVESQAAPT